MPHEIRECDGAYLLKASGDRILLTNAKGVEGGSFGLAYDPEAVALTGIERTGSPPDYLQWVGTSVRDVCSAGVEAGATLAWIQSLSAAGIAIAPGTEQEVFRILWRPADRPARTGATVQFIDCLRVRPDAPPVEITLSVEGRAIRPCVEDGWISIGGLFRRGDPNGDGRANIADAVSILRCLFLGAECPECQDAGDTNDDGRLNISDAVYLIFWLFSPDPSPAPPYPGAFLYGADPTLDRLGCPRSQTTCEEVRTGL